MISISTTPTPATMAVAGLGSAAAKKPITVLLVDDVPYIRAGLKMLLNLQADFDIVGEAEDGESALNMASSLAPQVVVMDVNMPGMSGFAATSAMRAAAPECAVVLLSLIDSALYRQTAREVGASAFVPKTVLSEPLIDAVRGAAG